MKVEGSVPEALAQVTLDNHPVVRWLMADGRRIGDPKNFLEGFALCLRQAGIDVTRITTGVPILHPQIFSFSGLWQLGKKLSDGERGWIPLAQAALLFSTEDRQYAFGELDDAGKNRLAMFAADHRCTPDFRPTEGRMYFRKYG